MTQKPDEGDPSEHSPRPERLDTIDHRLAALLAVGEVQARSIGTLTGNIENFTQSVTTVSENAGEDRLVR
jgi:hypothetical protein